MVTVESLFYDLNIASNSLSSSPQSRHFVTLNNVIPFIPLAFDIYSGMDYRIESKRTRRKCSQNYDQRQVLKAILQQGDNESK